MQQGRFLVEGDERVRSYSGIRPYVAVTNTATLARDYSIRWAAPDVLTYEPLFIRITWILDSQVTCFGKFSQFEITSQVVCGDKFLDPKERCDDGNKVSGAAVEALNARENDDLTCRH